MFADLNLHERLLRALEELSLSEPTPVQTAAIPPALAGRDLLCAAMHRAASMQALRRDAESRLGLPPGGLDDHREEVKVIAQELVQAQVDSSRPMRSRLRHHEAIDTALGFPS